MSLDYLQSAVPVEFQFDQTQFVNSKAYRKKIKQIYLQWYDGVKEARDLVYNRQCSCFADGLIAPERVEAHARWYMNIVKSRP